MTMTGSLCGALGATLQVPDLPRAGDEVDERDAAPSPAAVRQRRHRDRRKHGRFVVPVEVTCEMVQALVVQGDVDEANSSDLDCVGKAIAAAARRGLGFDLDRMSAAGG